MNVDDPGQRFKELLEIMARLRGEQGCPWDKEQTHASLKPCLLEETYELLDALENGDPAKIRDELGDVLLQVVFHSQIASEKRQFTAAEVITHLTEKLIRRHPYVFGGEPLPADTTQVLKQRLQIKANERGGNGSESALGNVPKAMPALARAQRITERASHLGFDWPNAEPVWEKIAEELNELKATVLSGNKINIAEEMGDLLFSVVNLSRFLDIQAEEALARTVDKFVRRFGYIEEKLREAYKTPDQVSLEEMDRLWEEAKRTEPEEKKPL